MKAENDSASVMSDVREYAYSLDVVYRATLISIEAAKRSQKLALIWIILYKFVIFLVIEVECLESLNILEVRLSFRPCNLTSLTQQLPLFILLAF